MATKRLVEIGLDVARLATLAAISEWTAANGHTVLDAASCWLTSNPATTAISGATKPEQVAANAAAGAWAMTAAERDELEALTR